MAKRKVNKKKSVEVLEAAGVVKAVSSHKASNKKYLYSFLLVEDDEENWYRTGFDKPDVEKGDEVSFSYEDGDYGLEVDISTLEVLSSSGAKDDDEDEDDDEDDDEEDETPVRKSKSSKSSKKSNKAASKKSSKPVKSSGSTYATKEEREEVQAKIAYQAARNSAISTVTTLIQTEQVEVPKTVKKRKDAFDELVNEYTETYFRQTADVVYLKSLLEDVVDDEVDEDDE